MTRLIINTLGLLRIDGIPICRVIQKDEKLFLQFKDQDRMRSSCRGSCFVEIELVDFEQRLQALFVLHPEDLALDKDLNPNELPKT